MTAFRTAVVALIMVVLVVSACKKDANPYSTYTSVQPTPINAIDTINPNSFVGIHYNILKPTCANSGCHDGTFEPDFRTVESAYNTLVYRPVVKNSPEGSYTYRVMPGEAENSVFYKRLVEDIDGQSGTMPLSVDPESTWNTKKDQFIQNIKTWINNGAIDQFGDAPSLGNLEPVFKGVMAYPGTQTTPLNRQSGKGAIIVPQNVSKITLYFSLSDDTKPASGLTYNKFKLSADQFDYTTKPEMPLVVGAPVSGPGYFGETVDFTHSIQLDMAPYAVGQKQFIRIYVSDGSPTTEMPKNSSADYIKLYFSFVRI